jgi:hypothetical protein
MCKNNILRAFEFMTLPGMAWKSPTVLGLDSADTILPNDSNHADHLRMCRVTAVKVHLNIRGFRKTGSNAELSWACTAFIWDLCLRDVDQRWWIMHRRQLWRIILWNWEALRSVTQCLVLHGIYKTPLHILLRFMLPCDSLLNIRN